MKEALEALGVSIGWFPSESSASTPSPLVGRRPPQGLGVHRGRTRRGEVPHLGALVLADVGHMEVDFL